MGEEMKDRRAECADADGQTHVTQLAYMFLAVGVGAFSAAIFHLFTHAFCKAWLFLGARSVIHALEGEQCISKMVGLRSYLSTTYCTYLIAALSIACSLSLTCL